MKQKIYIIINLTLIIILMSLGIYGYINKDNNNENNKTVKNEKKTSNTLTLNDKTYLSNIATSIFNDSFEFLTFKSDENILISEEGKITSAAKVMYLNGEFNNIKKITKQQQEMIVNKTNEIYNSAVEFKDFTINYSNEYCGVGGYTSNKGVLPEKDTKASGKCTLPFMLFEVNDIKQTSENEYTVKVNNAFVLQEDIKAEQTCKKNEEVYSKIITAFSDNQTKHNIYSTKVSGCCPKGSCETAAIYNEKDKIMNIAEETNSYYNVVFKKENNIFKFKSILKAK